MSNPTFVISLSPQAKWYVLIWFKFSIPLTCLKIFLEIESMKKSKIFESTEEIMARYEMANSEANEELIAEIHILKDSMKEINDKENFINFTPI